MDTYDEDLNHKIDAWDREQLTASPEWEPEQYITIRQHLERQDSAAERDGASGLALMHMQRQCWPLPEE